MGLLRWWRNLPSGYYPAEPPLGSRENPQPIYIAPAQRTHNYVRANPTHWSDPDFQDPDRRRATDKCIGHYAERGWRLVAVISDTRPGYADEFIFERPVGLTHPDD